MSLLASDLEQPSRLRRMLCWFFSWRGVRCFLFLAVAFVTAVFLVVGIYNWYFERSWKQERARLETKGEKLRVADFAPPEVPDDQNMAMIPLFKPLITMLEHHIARGTVDWPTGGVEKSFLQGPMFSVAERNKADGKEPNKAPEFGEWILGRTTDLVAWQDFFADHSEYPHPKTPGSPGKDVLFALSRDAAGAAALIEGAKRPFLRFPVHYGKANPASIVLPHLTTLKRIATYEQLAGVASLSEGQTDQALDHLFVGFRLLSGVERESMMISQLVHRVMFRILSQIIWEGAVIHAWKEPQLLRIQEELSRIDFIRNGDRSIRLERAFANTMYDFYTGKGAQLRDDLASPQGDASGSEEKLPRLLSFIFPSGLLRQNQITHNACFDQFIELWSTIQPKPGEYRPVTQEKIGAILDPILKSKSPSSILVKLWVPAMDKFGLNMQEAQAWRDVMLVGLALERARLVDGDYPESLATLSTRWLEKVPGDIFNGKSLGYRKDQPGHCVVYSVGPDGVDDQGKPPASLREPNPNNGLRAGQWTGTLRGTGDLGWRMGAAR